MAMNPLDALHEASNMRLTVRKLIAALSAFPPDTPVFMPGYEGGLEDVSPTLRMKGICLNRNDKWYYGPHEEAEFIGLAPNVEGVVILPYRQPLDNE